MFFTSHSSVEEAQERHKMGARAVHASRSKEIRSVCFDSRPRPLPGGKVDTVDSVADHTFQAPSSQTWILVHVTHSLSEHEVDSP